MKIKHTKVFKFVKKSALSVAAIAVSVVLATSMLPTRAVAIDEVVPASAGEAAGKSAKTVNTSTQVTSLATQAKPTKGRYLLRPALSHNRVVSIKGSSKKNHAYAQIKPSTMSAAQTFSLVPASGGKIRLKNVKSGKYLEIKGASKKNGTKVWQAKSSGSKAQRFKLVSTGTNNGQAVFRLRSALKSSLYLTVSGNKNKTGAALLVKKKGSVKGQSFAFLSTTKITPKSSTQELANGIYKITSKLSSSYALGVKASSKNNGAALELAKTSAEAISQLFQITWTSGYYKIRPLVSTKAAYVPSGNIVASTKIQQYNNSSSSKQKFKLMKNSDGSFSIQSYNGEMNFAVDGGAAKSGAAIQLWYPSTGASQKFDITAASGVSLSNGGVYSLTPFVADTKRIDVSGQSRASGASAVIANAGRNFGQKFTVKKVSGTSNTYTFQSILSGLFITSETDDVKLSPESAGDDQKWKAEYILGGIRFTNLDTGKSLEIATIGTSTTNYDVITAAPSSSTKQAFAPAKTPIVTEGYYKILSKGGLYVNIKGGSYDDGVAAELQANSENASLKFEFTSALKAGYQNIQNAQSLKMLDVKGNGKNAVLYQLMPSDKAEQNFKPIPTGDGWFYLQAENGSYMTAATATAGSQLTVTNTPPADAQMFRFEPTSYSEYVNTKGKIVDLSKWDTVKDSAYKNLSLAILRTSHGGYRTIDQKYQGYAKKCKLYKVPYGCYNFAAYKSNATAKKEAREMWDLSRRGGARPKFYVIDVEVIPDNWGSQSKGNMGKYTKTFLKELRRLGAKKVGIYTGMYLIKPWKLAVNDFDFVWIPRYGKNNGKMSAKPTVPYDMWQYTSKGKVSGISANCDLNVIKENGPNKRKFSWYTK